MDAVVERIYKLLKEQGKEVKELAEYIGLTASKISDWKAGRAKSYYKYTTKIAEFFGVSVDYLTGKDEIKNRSMPEDMERLYKDIQENPEIREYVQLYSQLSPEAKQHLRMYVDLLLRGDNKANN